MNGGAVAIVIRVLREPGEARQRAQERARAAHRLARRRARRRGDARRRWRRLGGEGRRGGLPHAYHRVGGGRRADAAPGRLRGAARAQPPKLLALGRAPAAVGCASSGHESADRRRAGLRAPKARAHRVLARRLREPRDLSPRQRCALADAMRAHDNILSGGGTGSGKTTFANALVKVIAEDTTDVAKRPRRSRRRAWPRRATTWSARAAARPRCRTSSTCASPPRWKAGGPVTRSCARFSVRSRRRRRRTSGRARAPCGVGR